MSRRSHVHRPVSSSRARALSLRVPAELDVAICVCGAFRLAECNDWIESLPPPKADETCTFRDAERLLRVSNSTVFALIKVGVLRGHKRHVLGRRAQWRFTKRELRRVRRLLARKPG